MSQNVFIPSTRKNSDGSTIQEDVEFVFWRNPKNGNEYKLLNLENDNLAPRQGMVELKPIKVSNRHDNNVGFGLLSGRNDDGQYFIGLPIMFDHDSGKPMWEKINISNFETYDLSIQDQRQKWIMVKNSPYYTDVVNGVEQNKNFNPIMKARYKAIDKEREANTFMKSIKIRKTAEDIAEALLETPKELEDVALMCGEDPKGMSTQRLWAQVYKFAQNKPEEFMKIYKSDTKTELSVLKRGLVTGVLHESLTEGTNFNGLSLGHTQEQCLSFLKDHPQTLAAIDSLSRKMDKETLLSTPSTKGTVTEQNAKELVQAKRIRELEAQLAATNATKVDELSAQVLNAIDADFVALLAEAKRLNIKGAHLIKNKENLREKVEAAQKLKVN